MVALTSVSNQSSLPLEAEKTQTCPSLTIKESTTSTYQVAMSAFMQ